MCGLLFLRPSNSTEYFVDSFYFINFIRSSRFSWQQQKKKRERERKLKDLLSNEILIPLGFYWFIIASIFHISFKTPCSNVQAGRGFPLYLTWYPPDLPVMERAWGSGKINRHLAARETGRWSNVMVVTGNCWGRNVSKVWNKATSLQAVEWNQLHNCFLG